MMVWHILGFLQLRHLKKMPLNHSKGDKKENPTKSPNVPPTLPTIDIQLVTRNSFLTTLKGRSDLKSLFCLGSTNLNR